MEKEHKVKIEVIVPADDLVCLGKDKLQELIRCKDCEYFCTYTDGSVECDNMCGMVTAGEDGFCSFAERRK